MRGRRAFDAGYALPALNAPRVILSCCSSCAERLPHEAEACMASHRWLALIRRSAVALAIACASTSSTLPVLTLAARADGPASVADLVHGLLDAVVNVSTSQTVKGGDGQGETPMPKAPEDFPYQDFFKKFFDDQGPGAGPARQRGPVARLGLRHRRRARLRGDQQPCHRRRRRHRGQFQRRDQAQGIDRRHRHQDRYCGAEDRPESPQADRREVRRFATRCASATGSWRSAIRSVSAAR